MNFFARLISNHPLTNVLFVIVILLGIYSYATMARQQDPDINFNWVEIRVVLPGATTSDVEKQVTDVIEDALSNIQDVRFVQSTANVGVSTTLVRFKQLNELDFNKRIADLRREVQNAEGELPSQALSPTVVEVTTSTGFPTMAVLIERAGFDETLFYHANLITKEIERIRGIDNIWAIGYSEPEIHINLNPAALESYGISPGEVAQSLRVSLVNLSPGSVDISGQKWQFSLDNDISDARSIARVPILGHSGIYIGNVAEVKSARERSTSLVSVNGKSAILLNIFKAPNTNVLDITDRVRDYIDEKNIKLSETGVRVSVLDDQSPTTRRALSTMEKNSMVGLILVLLSTWLFLGTRISIFCTLGIPFVLCLTFFVIKQLGQTLNLNVLLGLVMSVGIVVDNMIVIAESIRFNLRRGMEITHACVEGLLDVIKPLTSGVLTTVAAFAPLLFIEGILGQFMLVVPLVVVTALLMSMIQAYWILPSHVMGIDPRSEAHPTKFELRRMHYIEIIQRAYMRFLIRMLRAPRKMLTWCIGGLVLAGTLTFGGIAFPQVHQTWMGVFFLRIEFFAFDPLRLSYYNVKMPSGTALEQTLQATERLEQHVRALVPTEELRGMSSFAGIQFTDIGVETGPDVGQVMVSLLPDTRDSEPIDVMRDRILASISAADLGANELTSLIISGGPPQTKPIQLNVLGDDFESIRAAIVDLKELFGSMAGVFDIGVDDSFGQRQVQVRYNHDAIAADGISHREVDDLLAMVSNGLIITEVQRLGETTDIRLNAERPSVGNPGDVLDYRIRSSSGNSYPLSRYVQFSAVRGQSKIGHFDYRRNIRIEADINSSESPYTEQTASSHIHREWKRLYAAKHPSITLNSSGILDDLNEAIASMSFLFLLGLLLIYLLLCNALRSYFKPFLILTALPMAFVGVIFGLLISNQPMSLFTMFGVVGLTGISVNASIVLIDAIEKRRAAAMPLIHAALFAARRRVIPILITSLTTMAGLMSLALGIGGKSLLWGPVAIAIVWGVGFSAAMTLMIIPYLYLLFHRKGERERLERLAVAEAVAAPAPAPLAGA